MSWISDIKLCLSSLARRVTIIEQTGGGDPGSINLASPPAIGNVTPNTGKFTTLQATSGFTGNVTGNVSGSAATFTGLLSGDVTGTQLATAISASTVTGKALTGYVSGAGTVSATDSILSAINKLNGNDALKANIASPTFTGTVSGTFSGPLTGNVTGNVSGTSANFTGTLSGDVTGTQLATAISAATVTGKALTGYVSGAGTVSATDSILSAINKLNGNTALKADTSSLGTLATQSGTFSGTHSGSSSGTNTGDQTIALTGEVTGSGAGSFATSLSTTGVAAGSYTNANLTVDSKGRITLASSGTEGTGSGFIGTPNRIIVGASGTNADSNLETTLGLFGGVNSALLNVPTAIGSTNTNLVLTPKGAGAFIVGKAPDGVATGGGNARGLNAIDLQLSRTAANKVASADNSIAIGVNNAASGATSSTAIGVGCTASGAASTAIGSNCSAGNSGVAIGVGSSTSGAICVAIGSSCVAGSGNSTVAIGTSCNASAGGATAIGATNTASGGLSVAIGGVETVADRYGMRAFCAGKWSAPGDVQVVDFNLSCKTSLTSSPVEMALNGVSSYLTIPSGKGMAFIALIFGIKSDGTMVSFVRKGSIRNTGLTGTTALSQPVTTVGTDDNFSGVPVPIIEANDAADYLSIKVTAPDSTSVWRWIAHVQGVEQAYGT